MSDQVLYFSLTVRPQVPMGFMQGVPYVAAMGIIDGLKAAQIEDCSIAWPYEVRFGSHTLSILSRAGYDDEGMFVTLEVVGPQDAQLPEQVQDSVLARFDAWEAAVIQGRSQAGPLAFALSELFDMVELMGKPAEAHDPRGQFIAEGYLAGIDVWGRAILKSTDGSELEFAPAQARIRATI